jgi:hypothetical protein
MEQAGELINALRTMGEHEMADWVAITTIKGRSLEEQRWIDNGCPEDD